MSPASQAKRKKLAQYERTNSIRKLGINEQTEVVLDADQNDEMVNLVQNIENDDLEKLCLEGEKHGVGKLMKDIWVTDTQQRKEQFFNDQAKTSMLSTVVAYVLCHFTSFTVDFSGRGNRWSSITIRMGMYVIFLVVVIYFKSFSFGNLYSEPCCLRSIEGFQNSQTPFKSHLTILQRSFYS